MLITLPPVKKPCRNLRISRALGRNYLGTGSVRGPVVSRKLPRRLAALRRAFDLLGPRKESKTNRDLGENQTKTGPGGRSWGALGTTFHHEGEEEEGEEEEGEEEEEEEEEEGNGWR